MPKVFIKTTFSQPKLSVTSKNFEIAAKRAETIARNSILNNNRNGTKWPNLPYTSSLGGGPPKGQLSKFSSGSRGLASAIFGSFKPVGKNSVEIILKVDGRKSGTRWNKSGNSLLPGKAIKVSEYAATQEFGLPSRNVAERPYLRPAIQMAFKNFKVRPDFTTDGKRKVRTFRY